MFTFSVPKATCWLLSGSLAFASFAAFSQQIPADTTQPVVLEDAIIIRTPTHFAAPVEGTILTAGRRNEIIRPSLLDANLVQNNMRQVLGRVPGLMVWENDGSGQQINVATRGLSPNRSWEFNVRQNGYDVSSDPLGYPEAYYNPPLEAVERIQLIRGGAGLQFGPQFGGLLNYELKRGSNRPISFETQNTTGSNGLFNSYNALGGTVGKVNYYAYYRHRQGQGWRSNNAFQVNDLHGNLQWLLSERLILGVELTYHTNELQQPGGLTDAQFAADNRTSNRARNWFSTPWLVPALTLKYRSAKNTRLSFKTFGLVGERNSVGFVAAQPIPDTLNRTTGEYAARQVDRDQYRNLGAELRATQNFGLLGGNHTLAGGLRAFRGNLGRRQRGTGTTGSDLDLSLTGSGRFGTDLSFTTTNAAAFTEVLFRLTPRLSLTPGVRYEYVRNTGRGYLSLTPSGSENPFPEAVSRRHVWLYGLSSEYQVSEGTNLYANYSRSFRPVLLGDLVPPATTDAIDPNLKDARGYTAEVGYRGNYRGWLRFDVGMYYLSYQDRIGTLRRPVAGGTAGQTQQYRTNLGQTRTQGVEAYLEIDLIHSLTGNFKLPHLDLFGSVSLIDARYDNLPVTQLEGSGANTRIVESNLAGNWVENAPGRTVRTGLTFAHRGVSVTGQFSYVDKVYADANNTNLPTANGQTGQIPAYRVIDLASTWKLGKKQRYRISGGVNNLANAAYFTRRAGGYPGPGLLPADGRTWFASVGLTL